MGLTVREIYGTVRLGFGSARLSEKKDGSVALSDSLGRGRGKFETQDSELVQSASRK